MSSFYILGTNKEIKNIKTNLGLKEFDISAIKNLGINKEYLVENYYYEVELGQCEFWFGYEIRNIMYFNNDRNKDAFIKFLAEIQRLFDKEVADIAMYHFWDANIYDIEENYLYDTKYLTTNICNYPEDCFNIKTNTKYIFQNPDLIW